MRFADTSVSSPSTSTAASSVPVILFLTTSAPLPETSTASPFSIPTKVFHSMTASSPVTSTPVLEV